MMFIYSQLANDTWRMMMPVSTDPKQHQRQSERLASIAGEAPRSLTRIFTALTTCMIEASREVPDRVNSRQINGPGGAWLVSRFAAHGLPWVGVQWPHDLDSNAIDWLITATQRTELATSRPDVPRNQIWIYLGAR